MLFLFTIRSPLVPHVMHWISNRVMKRPIRIVIMAIVVIREKYANAHGDVVASGFINVRSLTPLIAAMGGAGDRSGIARRNVDVRMIGSHVLIFILFSKAIQTATEAFRVAERTGATAMVLRAAACMMRQFAERLIHVMAFHATTRR